MSLPGNRSAFVQDCNVYLKGMFNHRFDFFMSFILYPCDWKNTSVSNASMKSHYLAHYCKRLANKSTQIIGNP